MFPVRRSIPVVERSTWNCSLFSAYFRRICRSFPCLFVFSSLFVSSVSRLLLISFLLSSVASALHVPRVRASFWMTTTAKRENNNSDLNALLWKTPNSSLKSHLTSRFHLESLDLELRSLRDNIIILWTARNADRSVTPFTHLRYMLHCVTLCHNSPISLTCVRGSQGHPPFPTKEHQGNGLTNELFRSKLLRNKYLQINYWHKTIYEPLRCQDLTAFEEDPAKWATEQTTRKTN